MEAFSRNQLVWLDPQAWVQVRAHAWDPEAQAILAHWHHADLPLVVCRQRAATEIDTDQISLGLPAPLQWSRRRLALTVRRDQIVAQGSFPTLLQVGQEHTWKQAAQGLTLALTRLGVTARIYGSHGWQWLTGMAYLHGTSDIDVTVDVPDLQTAGLVVALLAGQASVPRLDGEIVFPGNQAVAWRELQQMLREQTTQVMLKERQAVRLVSLDDLWAKGPSSSIPVDQAAA